MQEDDMSLDMEIENQPKKMPLRGRRSTPHQSPRGFAGPASPKSGAFTNNENALDNLPQAPPRSKKAGGWASEILSGGFLFKFLFFVCLHNSVLRSRKSKTQTGSLSPPKETQKESIYDREDSDSDVPVIPDLDEIKEEDFVAEVAQAPVAPSNRVATFQELDNDLIKNSAFSTLDNIDLRVLTKCLSAESEIKEEDVPWTWDILFTEVSSSLSDRWEGQLDKDVEAPQA